MSISFLRKQNFKIKRMDLAKLDKLPRVQTIPLQNPNPDAEMDINEMVQKEFDQEVLDKNKQELKELHMSKPSHKQVKTDKGNKSHLRVLEEDNISKWGSDRILASKESADRKSFQRFLKVIEAKIHAKARVQERSLSSNDFDPDAIYSPRLSVDKLNQLKPFFYDDSRGLHPILIDGLTDFTVDYDSYLKKHYQKHKDEELNDEVVRFVIVSISREEEFNQHLHMEYPKLAGNSGTLEEFLEKRVYPSWDVAFKLQQFEINKERCQSEADKLSWNIPDQFTEEGMPEMNYIIN